MVLDTLTPACDGERIDPEKTVECTAKQSQAVVFTGAGEADLRTLSLTDPEVGEIVVDAHWSGISTGTERMLWSGEMPPFPGLSYPLVPGYETVGRVIRSDADPALVGQFVFVPGARCFREAAGLFGATASRLVVSADRVTPLGGKAMPEHTLLALAATAHHAILRGDGPELIIGHGVLGRLAARLTLAMGHPAPTVWEINPVRRGDAEGYVVVDPSEDARRDYGTIMDLSGDAGIIDAALAHARRGVTLTLAGFYKDRPAFDFPAAFMREASLLVAAEFTPADMAAVTALQRSGALNLAGLITHTASPQDVGTAYRTAFSDPACLKLIIDWGA
ncbi:MAG: chlorophyll synthesis pathway protein BchC [Pseudomonadota bacterium]